MNGCKRRRDSLSRGCVSAPCRHPFGCANGLCGITSAATCRRCPPLPQDMKLFSGNANVELSQQIAEHLGKKLGNITVSRFADGASSASATFCLLGVPLFPFRPEPPRRHSAQPWSCLAHASAVEPICR